jgi:hypothetical protein
VVTRGDIGVLSRDLFIADAASNYRELLISADGRELPIASDSSLGSESVAKSLTGLPERVAQIRNGRWENLTDYLPAPR